jgi:hypothetical protein
VVIAGPPGMRTSKVNVLTPRRPGFPAHQTPSIDAPEHVPYGPAARQASLRAGYRRGVAGPAEARRAALAARTASVSAVMS